RTRCDRPDRAVSGHPYDPILEIQCDEKAPVLAVSGNTSPRDFPTNGPSEAWKFGLCQATVTRAMLPVTVQFIIAMLAHAINERMARRVEYLQEEVRVLKEALVVATGKTRIAFTSEQRRRLALKGKALTPVERTACCQVVRSDTLLTW